MNTNNQIRAAGVFLLTPYLSLLLSKPIHEGMARLS